MAQKSVLLICGDYMEDYEVIVPFQVLTAFGIHVDCASPGKKSGDKCLTAVHDYIGYELYTELPGHTFVLNSSFQDINPENYDALVIPGGRFTELLSVDQDVLNVVTKFAEQGKPIAATCHSQLVLIAAGIIKGKKCTAFPSVKPVIKLAGGVWLDPAPITACFQDGNIISAVGWPAHAEYLSILFKSIEIVESADAYLFAGPIFNDYSSVGYSLLLKKEKAIVVQPDRVVVGNGPAFGCILMKDFLSAFAKRIKRNTTAYENYHRIYVPDGVPLKCEPQEPLRVNVLFKHIQAMFSGDSAVIAETGDSWFNCQKLKLPQGCGYEFHMQFGSIGWSVGATLGYAQAAQNKRVISCIGDGSFQVTAQDVSTMIRCGQRNSIFLINNGGYTIEVEIHDGPYNVIKNWNYTGLVEAIHNGEGKCWTAKVRCEEDLVEAIETATGEKEDCLCFIELICLKDDTSKELLEWGSRVSAANSRPPNPQ